MFIPLQFGLGQGRVEPTNHEHPMRLFSSDLVRNFGIGFVVGALLVAGANAENRSADLSSPAQAAPMVKAPAASAEFVIADQGMK